MHHSRRQQIYTFPKRVFNPLLMNSSYIYTILSLYENKNKAALDEERQNIKRITVRNRH